MQSINVAKVSKQQNTGGNPRLARDLTQVLFLACSTILLCMITWNESMVQWLHGTHQSCHFVFVYLFVLFCFVFCCLFSCSLKTTKTETAQTLNSFELITPSSLITLFYYCIAWHMYVQVKYFFYSIQMKTWVPHMNNKQRNKIYMYKRFTV